MKKLLLILLLFTSCNVFSQGVNGENKVGIKSSVSPNQINNSVGIDAPMNRPTGITYNVRALAFFDRVTALGYTLHDTTKAHYDSIFVRLTDSLLIGSTRAGDSVVAIYELSLKIAPDSTIAKLNLLDTAYNLTVTTPVVYSDSGARGNSPTSFMNTNFIGSADSTIYKRLSAGFGFISQSSVSGNNVFMGGHQTVDINWVLVSGGQWYATVNGGFGTQKNLGTTKRIISVSRLDHTFLSITNNEVSVTYTENSTANPNKSIYILATNSNGTTKYPTVAVISSAWITGGLSFDKTRKLHNIMNTALKPYGLNVY